MHAKRWRESHPEEAMRGPIHQDGTRTWSGPPDPYGRIVYLSSLPLMISMHWRASPEA